MAHVKVCTANGMVQTSSGLVKLSDYIKELESNGGKKEDITPFVLNPKHDNCHLKCPDPTKCSRTQQTT